jgi:NTP pyrophosphatase (non-canonical NTP hydrolase)
MSDERYSKTLQELIQFRDERDWKQFHDSKNLAIAISIEAAELNELFLWKTIDESEKVSIDRIKEELADILSFSFLLAEKHGLDPFEIVSEKIKRNAEKYPVDKAKGKSDKYDQL